MLAIDKQELFERVNKALDTIRPHLKVDGGDIEIIDINDDHQVMIKWLGNCEYCSMSLMTMKAGVEQAIKSRVPEITSIVAVNGLS